jgi:hypothetical protein
MAQPLARSGIQACGDVNGQHLAWAASYVLNPIPDVLLQRPACANAEQGIDAQIPLVHLL